MSKNKHWRTGRRWHHARAACVITAAACLFATPVRAADVRVEVSSRETQVGVPVVLQITIENAEGDPAPVLPAIPDVKVRSRGGPSSSSQMTLMNGAVQSRITLRYQYDIVPMKDGQVTIPAFEVTAGGEAHKTQPITLVVSKSEATDLLFVEITGDRKKLYVGESLKLKLQIWIRPFVDRAYGKLNEPSMWSCVDREKSDWGKFLEPLQQLWANRTEPRGREVLRKDSQGQERSYYLYEIEREVQADRPGPLSADEVNIVLIYPTRVGRSNDLFSMGMLRMTGAMPLSGQAKVEPIEVLPVPAEGKPAWYSGAVGQYTIQASAKPTEVAVGDPITLTLLINGTGNLQELQPPPLAKLPELTADFRVPTEALAGEVTPDGKRFSISIRASCDTVARIPPIPFAFFDPRQEKYVTVRSEEIPLKVKPAEKLALSQIVDSTGGQAPAANRLTESAGGILANYTGMDEVLSRQDLAIGPVTWAVLFLPPIGFAVSWTLRRRTDRLRNDSGFARRRRARRDAVSRLRPADAGSTGEAAAAVCAAMAQYVADRCNSPTGGMTRAAVVETLGGRGVSGDLVQEIDLLLGECEAIHYAGSGTRSADELRSLALRCIDRLEREKMETAVSSQRSALSRTGYALALFLLLGAVTGVRADALSLQQQVVVLNEGLQAFDQGAALRQSNPTQAAKSFSEAVTKFQLLVDSGVKNGKLYYDLANACLESGQIGKAILNYRRAQELIPDDPRLVANLRYARSLRRNQIAESGEQAFLRTLFFWHFGTSLRSRFTIGIIVYLAFWGAMIARTFGPRFRWRYVLMPLLIACALLSASVAVSLADRAARRDGVISADNVIVRKGNGDGFEPQFKEQLHEGVEFEIVEQRAEWWCIRLPDGKTGWIRAREAEAI